MSAAAELAHRSFAVIPGATQRVSGAAQTRYLAQKELVPQKILDQRRIIACCGASGMTI